MKFYFLIALLTLTIPACESTNPYGAIGRQKVVETIGEEVTTIPGSSILFIIRTSEGEIWFADTDPWTGGIRSKVKLFSASKHPNCQ